ncbi:MAG TPA: TlyA family RNA methyltransferase [Thermoclostridium caenicola]|uniref:23S rRNA (Cytidine1920-2'-O)/16S rRNA (Cytidine1409-2'-O)-methyltransferase n=1 Tax=Thermoclostridium caenicola TaxID=659425 RepID=A0A1M6BNH2_9FIRM|nr:TlyA family RNA methyltransferase [Thermoclostridium caenicola]SHI50252.1 23S rRNA (cytidine1920-2'-O)/16S rRNA (cytidine1409-2'-O)-methyltransferase [Thermoclostridium caenicola]HOK42263.1 TlyA family RNA methyltransferase [Thermoclostridium caenicola]HOL85543.1 TlyA family RNA methyltransferase [Thermoclostridium caenicola]HOP71756.1 TlyA family RNA methyltransferase [Thermoclostridium caenicola]HPO75976.1 TlyA family RNA methyltransferase [Thermoclostridium caenicola]
MQKERLDVLLVNRQFFESREKARRAIMAGSVFVDGERVDKAGFLCSPDAEITVKSDPVPYVSRGGLKLEKALRVFNIGLEGMTCVDVGASTGGFTDVMLKNGAAKVYAVDVGYGQLAWSLRNDPRVVCMERTNFRYVKPEDIGEPLDFGAADVSFISLRLILPPLKAVLKENARAVCLIKPQFEAGREKVGKKGVVRDPAVHEEVITQVIDAARNQGFAVLGLSWSPVKGPEGNIEYLLHLLNGTVQDESAIDVKETVRNAHQDLD